jgi:serine/threonine protein kinase
MSESNAERDPIERLADSFLARFRRGERPSIDEYAAKHPDLANEIRELLPALVALEQDMSIDEGGNREANSSAAERWSIAPRQLGEYVILREIGRGGTGVVYEAEQQTLGRHVALKVLPGAGLGGTHLQRFRLEARAAARLHHTNIVPVFGVGEAEGVHYYAMQFIQGQGLDAVIEELARRRKGVRPPAFHSAASETGIRPSVAVLAQSLTEGRLSATAASVSAAPGDPARASVPGKTAARPGSATVTDPGGAPEPTDSTAARSSPTVAGASSELSSSHSVARFYRAVAGLGAQVADALAYAHGQGILHRDIKPSNLLLDANGTVWVTDFGLAKSEGADGLTQTGDVVGTLRYMAPERFDGWSDPRSDVYALGATVYELLTLNPLYNESNRAKLIERILHDPPVPLSKLDRAIPRDLETIVLKALAKEPAQRYTTVAALGDDLRRFGADKPILARRSSPVEKAIRWCRRNPLAAGLLGMLCVVFITAFIVVTLAWRSALASGALAERRRIDAVRNEQEADEQMQLAIAGFAKARAAVDEYLNKVTDSQPLSESSLKPLRRDLLESGLRFYQSFLKEHAGDPSLRYAEADAQLRAAKILSQINPGASARSASDRARTLFESLARDRPGDADVQAGLAEWFAWHSMDLRAAALLEPLTKRYPENGRYHRLLLDALNSAAIAQGDQDDLDGNLKLQLRCFEVAKALTKVEPTNAENYTKLAAALNNLAIKLNADPIWRGDDALELLGRALSYDERCLELAPTNTTAQRYVIITRSNVADIRVGIGFTDSGLKGHEEVIALSRQLVRRNPEVTSYHLDHLNRLQTKAGHELSVGRKEQGAKTLAEVVELASTVEARMPSGGEAAFIRASSLARLAELQGELGVHAPAKPTNNAATPADAVAALEKAITQGYRNVRVIKAGRDLNILRGRADYQALVVRVENALREEAHSPPKTKAQVTKGRATTPSGSQPNSEGAASPGRLDDDRVELGDAYYVAGVRFAYQESYDESRNYLDKSLPLRETIAREHPDNAWYQFRVIKVHASLGELLLRQARLVEADRELAICRRQTEGLLRDHPRDQELAGLIGVMFWHLGSFCGTACLWDDARSYFERARQVGTPAEWELRSYFQGLLDLAQNNLEGYRKTCRRAVECYCGRDNAYWAADLAKLCSLAGDPGVDTAVMLKMGEHGASTEGDGYYWWMTFFLGLEYYRAGRYDDAERMLDRVADDTVLTRLGTNIRAMIEHKRGRREKAKSRLAEAAEIERNVIHSALGSRVVDLPWLWNTWLEFRVLHREAESLIEERPPREPWLPLLSARAEAARGRTSKAEALLAAAGHEAPDDPHVLAARARVWSEIGREAEALADLDRALTIDPTNYHALRERGRIALRQNRIDVGVADMLAALKRCSTETLHSFDERARVDNELAALEPAYREAIRLRPTEAPLRLARARYLAWQGRWAEADAEIGLAKLPPKLEQWNHRAALRLAANNLTGYHEICAGTLAEFGSDPTDDWARYTVIRALTLCRNDTMSPVKLAAWGYEITEAHSRVAWYRTAWAFALYRAGKYEGAAEQFVESLKIDRLWTGRPSNWLGLAMCDARRDRVEEGRVWLTKAERWIDENGRDSAAQARAFPPKVHEFEWIAANALIHEAREELEKAEANRPAAGSLLKSP